MASDLPKNLRLGTVSFSQDDWVGPLYPEGTKSTDYLAEYAKRYTTVEVDSTFYRIPSVKTVASWNEKTPEGFVFAAKVPRVITHIKFLRDCEEPFAVFVERMRALGKKLGPLVLQFRYYRKSEIASVDEFIERLDPFLDVLPEGMKFALEIRNKSWADEKLLDILRGHGVALIINDIPWMQRIDELLDRLDVVTSDFCYVRWMGDRKKISRETNAWNRIIVDRKEEMRQWVPAVRKLMKSGIRELYGFFSNYYAGYAPGSIRLFEETWMQEQDAGRRNK